MNRVLQILSLAFESLATALNQSQGLQLHWEYNATRIHRCGDPNHNQPLASRQSLRNAQSRE